MVQMVERFLQLHSAVRKASIDFNLTVTLNDNDVALLKNLVEVLSPIRTALIEISKRGFNLIQADAAYEFIFNSLETNQTSLSNAMLQAVKKRLLERRNSDLIGLLKYLHDPELRYDADQTRFFLMSNDRTIFVTAKTLLLRLFQTEDTSSHTETTNQTSPEAMQQDAVQTCFNRRQQEYETMQNYLKKYDVKQKQHSSAVARGNIRFQNLQEEIRVFELTGSRSDNLTLLYQALLTIPPTSVESERAFSVAGLFVTKLRSSLGDKSIDQLCFLKAYFKSEAYT